MKRPTLNDVAKLAGVTPTTVSRVINNRGALSDKTKQKVKNAMEELNYQPNALARTLLKGKSNIIGLIFPTTENIFYGQIVAELEDRFSKRGYKTFLCNSKNNSAKEKDFVQMLLANQVDGLIVGSHNTDIQTYQRAYLPIISIDRILADQITVVSSDNFTGGLLATQYLFDQGARKIAHVNSTQSKSAPYSIERKQGYFKFMQQKNLPTRVFEIDYELPFAKKKKIVSEIIKKNRAIDGYFVADDLTAILFQKMADEQQLNFKVIGYDGTDFIRDYLPDLATIQQPIAKIAATAVTELLKQVQGDFEDPGKRIKLPVKLLPPRTKSTTID